MSDLKFKNYEVSDKQEMNSEFINEVFGNFGNNIFYLFKKYKDVLYNINKYKNDLSSGINWYVEQAAAMSLSSTKNFTFSGYSPYDVKENITQDKLNGIIYLNSANLRSKIQRYTDTDGSLKAYPSTIISYNVGSIVDDELVFSEDVITDDTIRQIINNENNLWSIYKEQEYIKINVHISNADNNVINQLSIFPYGGSEIISCSVNYNSAVTTLDINSKFPYKCIDNIYTDGDFSIIVKGKQAINGLYYFSLRYIDVFACDYYDTGYIQYTLEPMSVINEITINEDYIREEYKSQYPIRIEIIDENNIHVYDTNTDSFPMQSAVNTNTSENLTLKISLTKVNDISPNIKYINII